MRRFLTSVGIPQQDIDDVLQEALLVAYDKVHAIPPAAERQFLASIAVRVASNMRRGVRRRERAYERYSRSMDHWDGPNFEEDADGLRVRALAGDVLDALTPEVRDVVLLCELGESAVAEAAAQLETPVGTAATRLRKGRRQLVEGVTASEGATRFIPIAPERAVLFHWWTTNQELDALDAILRVHATVHPREAVVVARGGGVSSARVQLNTRILWNQPPDTFQANVGRDVIDWVRFNGRDEADSRLRPVDDVLDEGGLLRVLPSEIVAAISFRGHAYAVPINILRTNTLFFHRRRFAELGIRPPTSLAEFFRCAEQLRRCGITPLALGRRQPWTLTLLAFENLMVSIAGADYYVDFFRGRKGAHDPMLRETLEALKNVLAYANDDAPSLTWDQAVDRVRTGAAAMTVIGDWARGQLTAQGVSVASPADVGVGESPDSAEIGQTATFGTADVFVFASDAFALSAAGQRTRHATRLLHTFSTHEAQVAFSRCKGSIPARTDIAADELDGTAQWTLREFRDRQRVPSLTSLVPRNLVPALDAALAQFAHQRDVDLVIRVLHAHYDLLRG